MYFNNLENVIAQAFSHDLISCKNIYFVYIATHCYINTRTILCVYIYISLYTICGIGHMYKAKYEFL